MFTFLCCFEIVGKSQRLEVPVLALLAAGSEALVPCVWYPPVHGGSVFHSLLYKYLLFENETLALCNSNVSPFSEGS